MSIKFVPIGIQYPNFLLFYIGSINISTTLSVIFRGIIIGNIFNSSKYLNYLIVDLENFSINKFHQIDLKDLYLIFFLFWSNII